MCRQGKSITISAKVLLAATILLVFFGCQKATQDKTGQTEAVSLADVKDWRLVVDPGAIPAERFAAQEFQRLFEEIAQ